MFSGQIPDPLQLSGHWDMQLPLGSPQAGHVDKELSPTVAS